MEKRKPNEEVKGTSFSVSSEGTSWNVKHKKLIPPLSFPLLLYLFFSHFQKLKANYTLSLSLPLVFPSFVFFFIIIFFIIILHIFFLLLPQSLKPKKEGGRLVGFLERTISTLYSSQQGRSLSFTLCLSAEYIIFLFLFSLFNLYINS